MERSLDFSSQPAHALAELSVLRANLELYLELRRRKFAPLLEVVLPMFLSMLGAASLAYGILGTLVLSGPLEIVSALGTGLAGSILATAIISLTSGIGHFKRYDEEAAALLRLNRILLDVLEEADPEKSEIVKSTYWQWERQVFGVEIGRKVKDLG